MYPSGFANVLTYLFLLLCGASSVSYAQTGFYASMSTSHMILKFEDTQFDENNASGSGYGVGASVGYGFNQHLTLMIHAATISLNDNDARMNQLELLGRYHLGKYRLQPFMETSVMGSLFNYSNNKSVVFSGLGIGVGGGIRIGITDKISLESGYRPVRFDFSKVRIDDRISDIDRISTTQYRTFIGLSLYLD